MKQFLFLLFWLTPLLVFSQDSTAYKNEIGPILTKNQRNGFGGSVRYTRHVKEVGRFKIELNTNFKSEYIGRIGYELLQIKLNKVEFGFGIDLKFLYEDLSKIGFPIYRQFAIEIPIELRIKVSNTDSLFFGFSLPKNLRNNIPFNAEEKRIEFRVGHKYHF